MEAQLRLNVTSNRLYTALIKEYFTNVWPTVEAPNGIGKMLLEAAETEAKSKGCVSILVRSYSFQAPHFYERYGYEVQHIVNGFPNGYNYYILLKRIG
jgi:hypothetical protein